MKIKKLFLNKFSSKGFTLIELLIVIAIVGILSAAVLIGINPVKKINQAKDSQTKSDIAQIASAMQAYYTQKGTIGAACYPIKVKALVDEGEMKTEPKSPVDGSIYKVTIPDTSTCTSALNQDGSCVASTACTEVTVSGETLTTPGRVWCWNSTDGTVTETTAALCMPPAQ